MKTTQETLRKKDSRKEAILQLACELSDTKWKRTFSDWSKRGCVRIKARNREHLQEEIKKATVRFKLSDDVQALSCCEPGGDDSWLHRYLVSCGIENREVLPVLKSLKRQRRAKTNRMRESLQGCLWGIMELREGYQVCCAQCRG